MSVTLSESKSKDLLTEYGLPTPVERSAPTAELALAAAIELGFPVVLKLEGDGIAHKTERNLVRLNLTGPDIVLAAAAELLASARPDDGVVKVLVAPMVRGSRELIVGMHRDPQFGATVMVGVGGVLAEAIDDVVFRPAPIDSDSARDMVDDLRSVALFGEFRGEAAIDRAALADVLVGLGRLSADRPDVSSVDVNPIIVSPDGALIAVDALVEIDPHRSEAPTAVRRRPTPEAFRALFDPRAVLVTGASTHPGKFGFVTLHNLLSSGYQGHVYATNLSGERVLGVDTVSDIAALPDGEIDLVFVCTPAAANPEILRASAAKGVKAAFLTSAGYGEAGDRGRRAELELVELADELGIMLCGPNGQGVVSTPANLCAQIVAPYPPAGPIAVASQSGNFVSSFLNLARSTGIGISRAVSAGNAAAVGIADYLEFFAADEATEVSLTYIEGITEGDVLLRRLGAAAAKKPIVLLKGGSTSGGAMAAASHTGALAADDAVFDGACRAHGLNRAHSVEDAFETAATFATQPLPSGPNVVVLTTAGGWGVMTADAITRQRDLVLMSLPDDLALAVDEHLPPRWSRANPVDCAGGETRDTIPTVMRLIAEHPEVDSIIYIGVGIQSNQARMMREGRFFPDHGVERIVEYHERQDRRFAEAAHELSLEMGKPILSATELAIADPDNPGPASVRGSGRLCYPSGERAVAALAHLVRRQRYLGRIAP
jgi:acyl-CoA synthetase (NDP forming)